jgi:hypothetical protein
MYRSLALLNLLALLLSACTFSLIDIPWLNPGTPSPGAPPGPTVTPLPSAAVTFTVTLPAPLPPGETLFLSLVDEITGLALNPTNHPMQGMDTLRYTASIPLAVNSVVKYRYLRQGSLPVPEDDSAERQVRYRMVYVTGPGSVEDVVASWSDSLFGGPSGRVTGQVVDASSGAAIPNVLIAAGGQQSLTDSSGRFGLEALPPGTHNMVAYAIDGSYQTFQQGVRVEAGRTTPVNFSLTPAALVEVIFSVAAPANTIPNTPIRFAGNLYQLGSLFGDLRGGITTVATRMPILTPQAGGYTISLRLPVGADLRYKYTLGDGFWNAEHRPDGSFVVRQLIVPAGPGPIQVRDVIETWQAGPSSPILFEVTVPSDTPASDIISMQFNPYGWTEPIPMWPRGANQWVYQLYSPLNMLGSFEYRYCRNDQCGTADDVATGPGHRGRLVSTSITPQDLQDTVTGWTWFQPGSSSLVGLPVTARPAGFWAGVEFLADYDPTWQAWTPGAIQDVKAIHANWLVLAPTWTVGRTAPFVFSPVPGADPLWADNLDTIGRARAANLNVALFPTPNLPADSAAWWAGAPRSTEWWAQYFERYTAFALYHADLAAKAGAQALILGGEWAAPALPGAAGAPADAADRWSEVAAGVRQRFSGAVYWAAVYPEALAAVPDFVRSLDGVYLLWRAQLSGSGPEQLAASAGQLLDSQVQPFQAALGKPVVLAAAYASGSGSAAASLPLAAVLPPGNTAAPLDLQAQADVYQGLMIAVNARSWLGGFVSRGYYVPVALQDASASVHGKPAADVLWYWYPRFLGAAQ